MNIAEYFKYTFLGQLDKPKRVIDINELGIEPSRNEDGTPSSNVSKLTRNKAILIANYVAAIASTVSLAVIVLYPFFHSKEPPCIFENILTSTLGWFGCSITGYVEASK